MKQISEDTIENIKKMLRNRNNYIDIKEVLDNLEDVQQKQKDVGTLSNSLSGDPKQNLQSCRATSFERSAVNSVDNHSADILNDLKSLLKSNRGRSSILNKDIEEIINKYGDEDETKD